MRGEDLPPFLFFKIAMETPPHAWGRRLAFPAALHRPGNTPTCVGKTPAPARGHAGSWKHPHMRGEDPELLGGFSAYTETPPHAWGRLYRCASAHRRSGNTPTCVGKTRARDKRQKSTQKHPHMRGEDRLQDKIVEQSTETPPHAWGRPCTPYPKELVLRKHPHMRGEDLIMPPPPSFSARNTPTCVGKTSAG